MTYLRVVRSLRSVMSLLNIETHLVSRNNRSPRSVWRTDSFVNRINIDLLRTGRVSSILHVIKSPRSVTIWLGVGWVGWKNFACRATFPSGCRATSPSGRRTTFELNSLVLSCFQLLENNELEVFLEESIEPDRISKPLGITRSMSTQYTASWCLFHALCRYCAWRGTFKSISSGSLWLFVLGINMQKVYCLSLAWILTYWYQSIVDDRMKIERTSNVVDVMEYSTLNHYIVL